MAKKKSGGGGTQPGTETVHLCLESRITPSRLRKYVKSACCCGMQYVFAFIQERNLARRWPVLSFVSHKQTFELAIYITV